MQIPRTSGLSFEMKLVLWIFSAFFYYPCQCDQLSRGGFKWWAERIERTVISMSPSKTDYKTLVSSYPYTCRTYSHPTPTHNICLNTGLSGNGGFISFLSITAQCSHGAPNQRSETVAACFCRKTQRHGGVFSSNLYGLLEQFKHSGTHTVLLYI